MIKKSMALPRRRGQGPAQKVGGKCLTDETRFTVLLRTEAQRTDRDVATNKGLATGPALGSVK